MANHHEEYLQYLAGRTWRGALYRRYWLYPRIAKRLRGRTLDVGCGIGDMLAFRPDMVGVDVNPGTVALCLKRGLNAHVMEPNRLPFADRSFDSVLMDNVLEHISQPEPLLSEIHRVLRPSGLLLVGVPGRRGWNSDPDHKVFYDEELLTTRVEDRGFEHREAFWTPLMRSTFLDRRLRQYCIYSLFERQTFGD